MNNVTFNNVKEFEEFINKLPSFNYYYCTFKNSNDNTPLRYPAVLEYERDLMDSGPYDKYTGEFEYPEHEIQVKAEMIRDFISYLESHHSYYLHEETTKLTSENTVFSIVDINVVYELANKWVRNHRYSY